MLAAYALMTTFTSDPPLVTHHHDLHNVVRHSWIGGYLHHEQFLQQLISAVLAFQVFFFPFVSVICC